MIPLLFFFLWWRPYWIFCHIWKCHENELVNIFFHVLPVIIYLLIYKNITYQFDYQKPKNPPYPMVYIQNSNIYTNKFTDINIYAHISGYHIYYDYREGHRFDNFLISSGHTSSFQHQVEITLETVIETMSINNYVFIYHIILILLLIFWKHISNSIYWPIYWYRYQEEHR